MRKLLLFGFIILQNLIAYSQDSLYINIFSKPDMTAILWQKFFTGDSVIFVIPDTKLNHKDSMILRACNRTKIIKKESELTNSDYKMKLHIWGEISDFKNWKKFDLPIEQTSIGFEYENKTFEKNGDCIFYLNSQANRLVYGGNTIQAIDPIRRSLLGTYQIYIFQYNLIIYNGNENEKLTDLDKIREVYFTKTIETKYFNFYLTSKSVVDKDFSHSMDNFIDKLSQKLNIDTENYKKVKFFLYNNLSDAAYLSGMPFPMQMSGLNVNNVAHSTSFDVKTIKHEATHWLISQKIGDNSNNFYVEGFRQYTDYLLDSVSYKNDLLISQENINNLTISLIDGDSHEFFSSPHNYPISGVFVKYLIDKVGLETFKDYYSADMVNDRFLVNHGLDKQEIIIDFKKNIQK